MDCQGCVSICELLFFFEFQKHTFPKRQLEKCNFTFLFPHFFVLFFTLIFFLFSRFFLVVLANPTTPSHTPTHMAEITSFEELNNVIAQANGKLVLIDFFATCMFTDQALIIHWSFIDHSLIIHWSYTYHSLCMLQGVHRAVRSGPMCTRWASRTLDRPRSSRSTSTSTRTSHRLTTSQQCPHSSSSRTQRKQRELEARTRLELTPLSRACSKSFVLLYYYWRMMIQNL